MWLTVALSLFWGSFVAGPVVSPLDDRSVAAADPSGVVRVSFDGGERWIAVAHCASTAALSWLDDDLEVACDGKTVLDGAELRAHWRLLAPTATPAADGALGRLAMLDRQQRSRLRSWLPDLEVAVRRAWSSSARSGGVGLEADTTLLVSLRWRLEPATLGGP